MYFSQKRVSRFLKMGFEVKYVSVSKSFLHIKTSFLTFLTNFNNISNHISHVSKKYLMYRLSHIMKIDNLLLEIGYEYVMKLI